MNEAVWVDEQLFDSDGTVFAPDINSSCRYYYFSTVVCLVWVGGCDEDLFNEFIIMKNYVSSRHAIQSDNCKGLPGESSTVRDEVEKVSESKQHKEAKGFPVLHFLVDLYSLQKDDLDDDDDDTAVVWLLTRWLLPGKVTFAFLQQNGSKGYAST